MSLKMLMVGAAVLSSGLLMADGGLSISGGDFSAWTGTKRYIKFLRDGTMTVTGSGTVELLMVGGGGAGGNNKGGGGGTSSGLDDYVGAGGSGVGGAGGGYSKSPVPPVANTGSGGGGGTCRGNNYIQGGDGADGVVIIRYARPTTGLMLLLR